MSIKKQMSDLIGSLCVVHESDYTANDVLAFIRDFVCEVIPRDLDKEQWWYAFEEQVLKSMCECRGAHQWELDHCGYWGHQYCLLCRQPKWPELNALRCSEAKQLTGGCSESEWIEKKRAEAVNV